MAKHNLVIVAKVPGKSQDHWKVPGKKITRSRPAWDICGTCPKSVLGVDIEK